MVKIISCFMEAYIKNLEDCLKSLTEILESKGINFCVIGAAALPIYGRVRMTEDIDILVSKKNMNEFFKLQNVYFRKEKGDKFIRWHWIKPPFAFDILFSKFILKGFQLPEPIDFKEYINGVPYLSLKKLIEFKLVASLGRTTGEGLQDEADIVELIKINNLEIDCTNDLDLEYQNQYIRLWNLSKGIKN